jgi:hypothetical protein
MNLNDIVGLVLLILGGLMILISLAAFLKVQFFTDTTRSLKDLKETLHEANVFLENWIKLLGLLPQALRGVFWMLTFGGIFVTLGLYLLIYKPIH